MTEIEELQKIQREASERRAERDRERLATKEASLEQPAEEQAEPGTESRSANTPPGESISGAAERLSPGLGDQLGSLLGELEEAARERPAIALLAAFSLGVIVGQLFSRK